MHPVTAALECLSMTRISCSPNEPSLLCARTGKSKKGKHARVATDKAAAVADTRTMTAMTVSMKPSHPSPRALGACEETFE